MCWQIRKQAIKDLPSLCRENKEHTQKIADILAQLLQADDNAELSVVHNSMMSLFKTDANGKSSSVRCVHNYTVLPKYYTKGGEECDTYLTHVSMAEKSNSTADESHSVG